MMPSDLFHHLTDTAHRGDVRLAAVCVVAVTVPSHGVAAIAIEIREHRVEHAARDGLDAPANHLEPRCKPAWRMHDARVAVADGSVHGHVPPHLHSAAIDGGALLRPVYLGAAAPEGRLAAGGIDGH